MKPARFQHPPPWQKRQRAATREGGEPPLGVTGDIRGAADEIGGQSGGIGGHGAAPVRAIKILGDLSSAVAIRAQPCGYPGPILFEWLIPRFRAWYSRGRNYKKTAEARQRHRPHQDRARQARRRAGPGTRVVGGVEGPHHGCVRTDRDPGPEGKCERVWPKNGADATPLDRQRCICAAGLAQNDLRSGRDPRHGRQLFRRTNRSSGILQQRRRRFAFIIN